MLTMNYSSYLMKTVLLFRYEIVESLLIGNVVTFFKVKGPINLGQRPKVVNHVLTLYDSKTDFFNLLPLGIKITNVFSRASFHANTV